MYTGSRRNDANEVTAAFCMIVVGCAITTLTSCFMTSFTVKHFDLLPCGFSVFLGITMVNGWGQQSGAEMSIGVVPSLYQNPRASNGGSWEYDWWRIAETIYTMPTTNFWLGPDRVSAALIWAGISICSPILAALGVLGAAVTALTMVGLGCPPWYVYAGEFQGVLTMQVITILAHVTIRIHVTILIHTCRSSRV